MIAHLTNEQETKTHYEKKMVCFYCFIPIPVLYHLKTLTHIPPGVERSCPKSWIPLTVINRVYCNLTDRKSSQHWNSSQPLETCLREWVRMRRCKTCLVHYLNRPYLLPSNCPNVFSPLGAAISHYNDERWNTTSEPVSFSNILLVHWNCNHEREFVGFQWIPLSNIKIIKKQNTGLFHCAHLLHYIRQVQ